MGKELENRILRIEERNKRVEKDKEWELSYIRKFLIFSITYIVSLIIFILAEIENPYASAIIPTTAFFLSTLSLSYFKKIWLRKRIKK